MLLEREGYRWVKRVKSDPGLEDSGWEEESVPENYDGPSFVDLTQGLSESEIVERYRKAMEIE